MINLSTEPAIYETQAAYEESDPKYEDIQYLDEDIQYLVEEEESPKEFRCNFCDQSFVSQSIQRLHHKRYHKQNQKWYNCIHCGIKSLHLFFTSGH